MAEGSGVNSSQLNVLCAAYQNVDGMSLHISSGVDESDMAGVKQSISWSEPAGGIMAASATFAEVTALVRYVRVWDGSLFIDEFPVNSGSGVDLVGQDVTVGIQHRVRG